VKLLLDENLSDRIISRVADLFPDSTHIKAVGLREADDFFVWEWAKKHGFTIVSKDTEFLARIPFESFSGLILEQLST
jgi:predicted nuclease of predicted toxin-antitoxin system